MYQSTYFAGDIAEVLIYNRALSGAERDAVNSYLNSKYAVVPNAPAAPTNLTASAVSPTQISLRWDFSLGNASTTFKIVNGSVLTFDTLANICMTNMVDAAAYPARWREARCSVRRWICASQSCRK